SGDDFFAVDDDDVIACVHVRRENRLVLAAQNCGNLRGKTPQSFAFCVHNPPLALDLGRLGDECFLLHYDTSDGRLPASRNCYYFIDDFRPIKTQFRRNRHIPEPTPVVGQWFLFLSASRLEMRSRMLPASCDRVPHPSAFRPCAAPCGAETHCLPRNTPAAPRMTPGVSAIRSAQFHGRCFRPAARDRMWRNHACPSTGALSNVRLRHPPRPEYTSYNASIMAGAGPRGYWYSCKAATAHPTGAETLRAAQCSVKRCRPAAAH